MKDMNRIFLIGRLGADAVLNDTKMGKKFLRFSMATSRYSKKSEDKEQEGEQKSQPTQWHNVVIWGKLGEACAPYLKKGKAVFVEGEVRTKNYLSKDGFEKFSYEVNAREINLLPSSFLNSSNHITN